MAWTLTVYNEVGDTVVNTFTDTDAVPGIDGGFRVTVKNSGDCVSLSFRGRNDLLQIHPRNIVHLAVDAQSLFWGVIVRNPNQYSAGAGPADTNSGDLEEFSAEGGRALMAQSQSGFLLVDEAMDVTDIMKAFLVEYGHPALVDDLLLIEASLAVLTTYYKPNASLDVVFDELVSTLPGWVWGVNADGKLFVRELDGQVIFQGSDLLEFVYRPIDSEDVVTKVHLVIAGDVAGREADTFSSQEWQIGASGRYSHTLTFFDYVPRPIVFTYEHELHQYFRAERSFGLPEGVNPFYEQTELDPLVSAGIGSRLRVNSNAGNEDIANIFDGDGTTYKALPAGETRHIVWTKYALLREYVPAEELPQTEAIVGFRVVHAGELFPGETGLDQWPARSANHVYHLSQVAPADSDAFIESTDVMTEVFASYNLKSAALDSGGIGFYAVVPVSAQQEPLNRDWETSPEYEVGNYVTEVLLRVTNPVTDVHVYAFYPLILNEELLTEIAKSNLRVPRALPGDVVVEGYSAPVPVVTVQDAQFPGGELSDVVEAVEYIATPEDGFQTRFVLGNDDTSEAMSVLSKYINSKVSVRAYALMMAARQ